MTRADVKTRVLKNLNDAGATYYTGADLEDAIQDAYDDIVALSQCNFASITLNWPANTTYFFLESLGATDYISTVAIYNHNTKRFLDDSVNLRQFDGIRDDWEIWNGQPEFWTPHTFESVAIAPRLATATGQYTVYYIKRAPVLAQDSDSFIFSKFADDLVETYVTADLLEQAEEFTKAALFWKPYFEGVLAYKQECQNLARTDLILHV